MMLDINEMRFSYRSREILRDITLGLERDDILSILGPNGVGKTTLLKCINGILKSRSGTILVDNDDLRELTRTEIARRIGYVPQRGEVSMITVFDAVLLGRRPYISWDVTRKDIEMTQEAIERLGLSDISLSPIGEISGGEHQKVQIARALVQEPKILLLDEPTSSLDLSNQHRIMDAVTDVVREKHLSAVMTMHDLNLALRYSNKFIMLKDGEIYAAGDHEIMTPENIEAVYGLEVDVAEYRGHAVVIPV